MNTNQDAAGSASRERAGVLTFTFPDQLNAEQRARIAAAMRATFGYLVQDARRQRASETVTR